ncbi:MAG: hypothetical protein ACJ789_16015 [Thermomicrobiales bacterium]
MKRPASYLEPFGWWGPLRSPGEATSLDGLIASGMLADELATILRTLVEARASIVVCAGPSGAGKTTFLTALLNHLPIDTTRVYIRGCYEPFDFFDHTDPATTALLVNEISPHLPIYLWGPGVQRVLAAAERGYQLAGTAHADSVEDFIYSLTAYPLRLPTDSLRVIDLLVLLDLNWENEQPVRNVKEVVSLSADAPPGTIRPERLAWRDPKSDELVIGEAAVNEVVGRLIA